jgi:uncharacterized protein (TIRG00374 family)
MSVTPGKMGELLKSFLLKEETGTPVSNSAPIVFAERITDFLSIILLCVVGAFVFNYGKELIIIVGLFFITCILLLSSKKLSIYIITFFEKIKFFQKYVSKLHIAYESIYKLLRIKPLIITIAISIISWFFECFAFYLVLKIFQVNSDFFELNILMATFIYGFSTLIGAIAMLPGGLGATEASLTGLLVLSKIPKDISVASTIIIRVATLWFAVLIGVISLYFYQKSLNKKLENLKTEASEIKIT